MKIEVPVKGYASESQLIEIYDIITLYQDWMCEAGYAFESWKLPTMPKQERLKYGKVLYTDIVVATEETELSLKAIPPYKDLILSLMKNGRGLSFMVNSDKYATPFYITTDGNLFPTLNSTEVSQWTISGNNYASDGKEITTAILDSMREGKGFHEAFELHKIYKEMNLCQ
jgi:hypothetical protein